MSKSVIRSKLFSRVGSLLLVTALLLSCLGFLAAAKSSLNAYIAISPYPVSENLDYPFPEECSPTLGETAWLNFACSSDVKCKKIVFLIQKPGSDYYETVCEYRSNNYFRWCAKQYTFDMQGQYLLRVDVTLLDGRVFAGKISTNVRESVAPLQQSENDKIKLNWDAKGRTGKSRDASSAFTLNGNKITPGEIFYTYYADGTPTVSKKGAYINIEGDLIYTGAAQCLAYVHYCQHMLFGCDSSKTVLYGTVTDDEETDFYGLIVNDSPDAPELKDLLKQCGEGTHIRSRYSSLVSHSLFVLRIEENGFYFTDANTSASAYGRNNIKIGYTTFADFADGYYSYIQYVEYYHG